MSWIRRMLTIVAMLVAGLVPAAPAAAAEAPAARTDVVLLFDTTGSMDDALAEASAQASEVVDRLRTTLPDVGVAIADLHDYPLYGELGDYPFRLVQGVTNDRTQIQAAIDSLTAEGGGDGPESYGRALSEVEGNATVGWREGARRVVVLIADNVPHDDDLNEGVPDSVITEVSPFSTKVDPGPDEVVGTADDLDWQTVLETLRNNGLPLMYVLYQGSSDYLGYWNHWAGLTGGQAVDASGADSGTLADAVVKAAETGATTTLPACPGGQERGTDRRCHRMPVVFLPGIMGSEIWCGETRLWFDYRAGRGLNLNDMRLADDGTSPRDTNNWCNANAGPKEGAILRDAAGQDAYGSTADQLSKAYGDQYRSFAYDWRKSPENAVADLDRVIGELRAANFGVRVRLAAHSMGGLVVRAYLEDAARSAKVAKVVTVGTPYWGAPKTLLPIARGDTDTAWGIGLDTLSNNGEMRDLSSTMAGLYWLMPSDAWHEATGHWLEIADKKKKPTNAVDTAKAMDGQWPQTSEALYNAATLAHRRLDGFKTGGAEMLAIVGAGKNTIGRTRFDQKSLWKDSYANTNTNGDGTVPLVSGAQGNPSYPPRGENVQRLYSCGVGHAQETGNATINTAMRSFLDGAAVEGLDTTPCASDEDEIEIRTRVPDVTTGRYAAVAPAGLRVVLPTGEIGLEQAQGQGLLTIVTNEEGVYDVFVPRTAPLTFRIAGNDIAAKVTHRVDGVIVGAPARFKPASGTVDVTSGAVPAASRRGKPLATLRRGDHKAPKTSLSVSVRGKRAVLTFRSTDASPVRAIAMRVPGKRTRFVKPRARITLSLRKPRTTVTYHAQDAFGNVETQRRRLIVRR